MVCGLLALNMILPARAAEPALHGQYPAQRTLLSTATTVTGQPIRYPQGAAAHVTVSEITLAPGEETGWHRHPVPVFGYILAGGLTVDYGPKGPHTYRTGDALVEAMNEAHNGRNTGAVPMRVLVIVAGAEGTATTVPGGRGARASRSARFCGTFGSQMDWSGRLKASFGEGSHGRLGSALLERRAVDKISGLIIGRPDQMRLDGPRTTYGCSWRLSWDGTHGSP